MKRILAGLFAFTTILCVLTSCGNDVAEEITDSSVTEELTEESEESESEESTEESEEESDTEESTEESEEESDTEEKTEISGEYIDTIQEYMDCMIKGDKDRILELQFPSFMVELIKIMADIEGEDYLELADIPEDVDMTDFRINEILSESPVESSYVQDTNTSFYYIKLLADYVQEEGKENLTADMIEDKLEELADENLQVLDIIKDCRNVELSVTIVRNDGTEDTDTIEIIVYNVDNEGWKIDTTMLSYVAKSKQMSANTNAATLMKAGNTALVELDEECVELPEDCIISSDDFYNYNVDSEFLNQFKERTALFFDYINDLEYFVVIHDGAVYYSAVKEGNITGTYPADILYSADMSERECKPTDYTYEDIYNDALEKVKNQ